ncbi:hypothetical protein Bbelb_053470 [Branchiostoma belcheri]|nr:hypothetical protein Bbelb_053470 [Branchiostoma belcheri]
MKEVGSADLVANELSRLNITIAGLTEVRWPGSGTCSANGFTYLWSGRDDGLHRQGVALALAPSAHRSLVFWKPVSNRLLLARLRHQHGRISIIVAYAPTDVASEDDKDEFYTNLSTLTAGISRHDVTWILGDLNATTGSHRSGFENCLGPHGIGNCNDNGRRLLEFCTSFHLRTERSFFQHKAIHCRTWISNDGRTTKEVDHILTSRRWHTSSNCRVYRTAEFGNTDHRLLAMTVCLRLQKNPASTNQRKFDLNGLQTESTRCRFQLQLKNRFSVLSATDEVDDPQKIWKDFKQSITKAASRTLGYQTLSVVEARRRARLRGHREEYRRLNSRRNKLLREDRQRWVDDLADQAETAARTGNHGSLYRTLRTLIGKRTPPTSSVKALDGSDLESQEQQLNRWKEHFSSLLNRPPPPPSPQLEALANLATEDSTISADPPTVDEVQKAVDKLKSGRAAGGDGIPPELLLKGGPAVAQWLHRLITAIWKSDTIPSDWRHEVILPFWKKGPKDICNNYRGITLLSVPGKVFAHVILARLRPLLLLKQRPEQSGFTPGRSTVDRVLSLRLLAEMRREYRKPLYAAYVDLKQAFDSVDRQCLWKVLRILGVPSKLLDLLSLLYSDTTSCVRVNGQTSDPFTINREHLTTYQVQQSADGLVFHRTKHGHAVKNAQAKNEKEMTYKHDIGFPHQIRVVESFTAPRKTAEGFDSAAGLPGDPGKHGKLQGDTFDLPMMHANSTSHMTFVGMTSLAADVIIPSNLTTGSLIIVQPRQPDLPLKDVEKDIVGNLTCVRKHLTKHQSATRSTCFLQLVKLVSRLSDHDIGVLSRRFVKIRHQHQGEEENCNIMVDVLGSVGTESAQRLLTFNVLQAEGAPAKLIQRMLISYVSMQTPPIEIPVMSGLYTTLLFSYWELLRIDSNTRTQKGLKNSQLRETLTVDELKRHNHEKATLLQALGNAEFDSSFHHLVSYLNNTDSPTLLRTSALSAIRKYKHDEYELKCFGRYSTGHEIRIDFRGTFCGRVQDAVRDFPRESAGRPPGECDTFCGRVRYVQRESAAAGLLLDSALFDEEEHVRYHAALQYQRHPKALNLRKMKQDQANGSVNVSHYLDDVISLSTAMSQNPHLRKRRGFVGEVVHALTEGIQFEMKLPGVDWKRKIGTDSIGAEFGLIMKNKFDLDIRLSEGHAKLDIYDHAYARGLLGVLDMTFDFMDTGICFSGGIYYKVNILQDYNFKQLLELIKSWFREVPAVIKDVKDTINTFKNLFAHLANTTPEEVFKAILDAIQTFPDRITAISRWTRDTMEKIGAYDNLPTFIVEARQVILRIATLFNDVKKDVTELVNTIADSIHVVLPWGAEQIWQGLQTISREISNLIRSPQTAAGNIAKAVYRIYYAVRGLISMKDQIDEVCFFKEGKQPYWFNLRTQIEEILDDIEHVWRLFEVEAPTWVDGIVAHSTDVLRQAFSHQTRRSLRREVIDEFKAALNDLPNQIGPTAHIIQPFLDAYTSTVGTVKKVKSYYDSLKQGRILDSETCGIGTYPSFGVVTATYTSKGIDLKIRKGRKVVAPFAGEITSISEEKITIASEDIKDMEIIIEGVEVEATLEEGQHIHKGGKVGKAAATGCRENSIHFAIKAVGAEEYVDPTRYLRKPMMTNEENKPGWRSECDVYWLTLLDKSIATGNLTDILKDEDETPEEPEVEVDDSARSSTTISSLSSTTYKRRSLKREIAVALTNNPDFAQSIGVDNMTDITKTFSVKLQDLKLSKVLDILQLLDGAETAALRDKLHSTAEQLQSPHTVVTTKASVRFDPCTMKLTLEIGDHKEEKSLALPDFAEEDEYNNDQSWTLFENMLLVRSFRVQRNGSTFKLRLAVKLCAGSIDRCLPPLNLLKDVIIGISPCDGARDATPPTRQTPVMDLTLSQLETELHHISRAEMRRILPEANLTDMNQLLQDLTRVLRASYKEVLVASIDMAVEEAVQELLSSDSYLNGSFPLGPWDKTFFEVKVPFTLGPITMYLKFAAGGYIGVTLEAGVSIMKMKAYGKATPDVSAVVEASVGVSILLIAGELQLKGYILTTAFPTTAEVTFDKFPLNVGVRMDMVMIPLRLELHGVVFILGGKIIDIMIWHYETSSVTKNIFNTGLPEPDLTPPKFRKFKHKNQASSPLGRRSEVTTHCDVEQLPGRDVMEPAFQLAVDAEDDVSQVKLTYDVGTYQAGSDVVKGEELGGPSNIIVRPMKGGVPLYFTVTAKNSGSGDAKVTCELPTYDVTLPGGRVTPDFLTTSHPSILRASAVAHDDSQIIHKLAAVGYGRKVYGDQIMAWHDVNTTTNTAITTGQGVSALDRFTVETSKVDIPEQCASKCLRLPPSKCLSFNYDYGHGDCELLEEIEGHGVEMHEVGHFHSFERLGVGHAMEFRHENLKLHHNQLYFFNFFLNNTLGYVNILTSRGVLADFTPPSPGLLQNVNMDVLMTEACEDFVLDHWEQARCVEQSPLQNHRWIVDGEGSQTVFNGHEPLVDMRYTRANRYVSANWDGFHDDETGIHGYSWTVGTTPCEEDVHPHIDPHAHLLDVSEWTHQGIASPLFLIDGVYHITVRAINNVEFGGAMATTVCHTTPYIIDNTPPFVHHVHSVQYDEDALVISAEYDVSDPLSDIREIDFGLGWSKRDVHMMDWYRHGNTTHTSVNFHIPDGIPAWVKVRAINNVDLREVGHAEYPLLVDTSPPIAGVLYDGSVHGHDLNFTSDPNTICANWKDFHDEQSGLRWPAEGVRHSHGCARCTYVVCTTRLAVSGCVHRTLRKW